MTWSSGAIWILIVALGIGTYLIRLSFLGLIGNRDLPPWLMRHLRYTPMAVFPALVAPLVAWPAATGGQTDPVRLVAALVTVAVGWRFKTPIAAILGGLATLFLGLALFG